MNCEKIEFNTVSEEDGKLTFIEGNKHIPFEIKRVFQIYGVPSQDIIRANHASINTSFVLQVLAGKVDIELDNGIDKNAYELDSINEGIFVPPLTWMKTLNFSNDAVLQVYASENYETCKYINNYSEFTKRKQDR